MGVARNVLVDPKLVPGGGAVELSVAAEIKEKSEQIEGVEQVKTAPFFCPGSAFSSVPCC
jgi:T-complex protein 1 subunit gamma